ncbi:MAG: hypothetical protein AAF702_17065 [Chloroflexota bacterium]
MFMLIGIFLLINSTSTVIFLAACVVSGRKQQEIAERYWTNFKNQMELASAIAKLRNVKNKPLTGIDMTSPVYLS